MYGLRDSTCPGARAMVPGGPWIAEGAGAGAGLNTPEAYMASATASAASAANASRRRLQRWGSRASRTDVESPHRWVGSSTDCSLGGTFGENPRNRCGFSTFRRAGFIAPASRSPACSCASPIAWCSRTTPTRRASCSSPTLRFVVPLSVLAVNDALRRFWLDPGKHDGVTPLCPGGGNARVWVLTRVEIGAKPGEAGCELLGET